ncbi:Purple acid phosphatase 17 [Platanthera zijinensis]|uniref:acid phosphatase n=1 Tax=Platanthera zijinensis TaxID=2320716 RepID=A0AAP0BKJ0_9ASPA
MQSSSFTDICANPEKVQVRVFSVGYTNKFAEVVVGSASKGDEYVTWPTGILVESEVSGPGWQGGSAAIFNLQRAGEKSLLLLQIRKDVLLCGDHPAKDGDSLRLLVVGDWGRKGLFNQSQVATAMGRIGEELEIDFVISTGDNFYENGLTELMTSRLRNPLPISSRRAACRRSVLGNHDYRGNVLAQLSPVLQQLDSRWICLRSFILDAEIADFFFVDTTPFVLKYWNEPENRHYDWREVAPRDQYIDNLLKDLDAALKESRAPWKLVVGHHTMRSVSEHGDTVELLDELLPILKENGVDLYINGHDHCLQHISSRGSQLQYLTSGGGSKAWRGTYIPNDDKLQFFYDGQGFMSMELTGRRAEMRFFYVCSGEFCMSSAWGGIPSLLVVACEVGVWLSWRPNCGCLIKVLMKEWGGRRRKLSNIHEEHELLWQA